MVVIKKSSHSLDVNCRHAAALTGADRHKIQVALRLFRRLVRLHEEYIENGEQDLARQTRQFIGRVINYHSSIATIEQNIYVNYQGPRLNINSEQIDEGMIGAIYRFKTREQLTRLLEGFQIPAVFVVPEVGYRFGGEELLLLVLERCALGLRYLDLQQKYHIHHSTICRGVNYFAKWFNENWGYLLRDNLDFWGDYLEDSRDAVKNKMLSQYDFNVDEEIEDEFTIAMFIDCTIIRTDRPGGGPVEPGVFAARYPFLVQEALYNGWKKCHGIKKQSIGMANGMAFHVSKGYSCRRNDLHVLNETNIDDRLVELTIGNPPAERFTCYGDSAYPMSQRISCRRDGEEFTELNKAMNGCRESIEWMYRDVTQYWKIIQTKRTFRLLTGYEKADNIIDLCFQFNNAWNTMNHNECSQWFDCAPPTFEVYTGNGPRAEVEINAM